MPRKKTVSYKDISVKRYAKYAKRILKLAKKAYRKEESRQDALMKLIQKAHNDVRLEQKEYSKIRRAAKAEVTKSKRSVRSAPAKRAPTKRAAK